MVTFTDGTTAGVVVKDVTPSLGVKIIQVRVPATFVWGTDEMVVDLADYGARDLAGILPYEESTAGSITISGCVTTLVSGTTVTAVSTGSTVDTCGGSFIIFAY